MSNTIEVDCSAWLTAQGVETSCYFGDACEPFVASTESLEDLIDKELFAHTVNGVISARELDSVHEFLTTLMNACKYAEKRIKELSPSE